MVQCGFPAVIKSVPAIIPQLSDPPRRYSRNIHTHYLHPRDSRGFRGISAVPIPVHISNVDHGVADAGPYIARR